MIMMVGCGGSGSIEPDEQSFSLFAIDPPYCVVNTLPRQCMIMGAGFVEGSQLTVAITRKGEPSGWCSDTMWVSSTEITCIVTPPDTGVGLWNVVVTNGNGDVVVGVNMFVVRDRNW